MTRKTYEWYDYSENKLYIQHVEDVEPLLEENKDLKNSGDGWSNTRTWRKIGSIPSIVAEKILREKGINILENTPEARRYIKKFLNNNPAFRTVDRRV